MLTWPVVLYKDGKSAAESRGGWNLREVEFQEPVKLEKWSCLRILDSTNKSGLGPAIDGFRNSLHRLGIQTSKPIVDQFVFDNKKRDFGTSVKGWTLEDTIREMHVTKKLDIILVFLPGKDTALYNRIKNCCDKTEGVHTVCVLEQGFTKRDATYFANVALKFNLKLGGKNHVLNEADMGIISRGLTMVVGIDVIHPSPGSGKASIASMVASIDKDLAQWPVDLRVQVREGQEMLDKIHAMLATRLDLWKRKHDAYPENILIYRDGVSEGQYQQVLDQELALMQKSCNRLYYNDNRRPRPRFTLIVVGKRHHTRFYPPPGHPHSDNNGNPNRGLVVDRGITEARNWDFFLQSHNAIKGTARPAHYYVLWDEIFTNDELKFSHTSIERDVSPADRLERLSHSLCYMFSRASKAVSIPAPVYYADIACTRAGRYLVDVPSGSQSATTDNTSMTAGQRDRLCTELQARIKVHTSLENSMFYV